MLSKDAAADTAMDMLKTHRGERDLLDHVRRYWKGRQPLPAVIPRSAPREVHEMARMSRVNVSEIIVNSLAQSMRVDGFRLGGDGRAPQADMAPQWAVWQANRMDKWQSGLHRAAVAYGRSYEVVLPGDSGPSMRPVSPRRMLAVYADDKDWPFQALEARGDGLYALYDDTHRYWLDLSADGPKYVSDEAHGAGVVPVVRFVDLVDLDEDDEVGDGMQGMVERTTQGQIAPQITLQDQIDLTTFNLLVAQHYGAFRQRYVLGWVAETEDQQMKAAASQLWTFEDHPDDMKLGEFSQTDLSGYATNRDDALRYAATLSQTPVHELTGQLVNLSAEALAAAEAGKERKVDEITTSFGESHEQAFWLAGRYTGRDVPDDSQMVWSDTSARSFAATVDALGKLSQMLQVPPQELWERIPNTTQADVERWKQAAAQGDTLSEFTRLLDAQAA